MEIMIGVIAGVFGFLFCYCLLGGLYTINQNERAVVTNFGKAERIGKATNLDLPIADTLRPEEKERYILSAGSRDRTGRTLSPDAVATGV
jgi:regulator of protease activity HflC (stomatin/prohibitin superfamily)